MATLGDDNADQRKLDVLNNTFSQEFVNNGAGRYEASFGMGARAVTDLFTALGLEEGRDFAILDPRAGIVVVDLERLPDPLSAGHSVPQVQALGYAAALESALGAPVGIELRYDANAAAPITSHLEVETGDSRTADDFSMLLTQVRRDMRIPREQLPIGWGGGTSFTLSADDIAAYDANHGANGAFFSQLSATLQEIEVDTGKPYSELVGEFVDTIRGEEPELSPDNSVTTPHTPAGKSPVRGFSQGN